MTGCKQKQNTAKNHLFHFDLVAAWHEAQEEGMCESQKTSEYLT